MVHICLVLFLFLCCLGIIIFFLNSSQLRDRVVKDYLFMEYQRITSFYNKLYSYNFKKTISTI